MATELITPTHLMPLSSEWGTSPVISRFLSYPQVQGSPAECPTGVGIVFALGAPVSGLCHTVAALTVARIPHG